MRTVTLFAVTLLGCSAPTDVQDGAMTDVPSGTDLERLDLEVSLASLTATARVTIATDQDEIALEAGGLSVTRVLRGGNEHAFTHESGQLILPLEPGTTELSIEYAFSERSADGWLTTGSTLTWPYHCGNLFPCISDPSEGIAFSLAVTDAPPGEVVVFPPAVTAEVPAYVLAWASGAYTEIPLGTTPAGTALSVWSLPGTEADAATGTESLVAAFDWLETRLGAYAFGSKAGSVEADWAAGAYGGMEHHPYWHVGSSSMDDETTHVHEAAHGWFGDSIRIACWEDFVLSEGTVSYLTARILTDLEGESRGEEIWSGYRARLTNATQSASLQIAWPEGCNAIDILEDGLFSSIPYMKGAFFFRALEARVGVEALVSGLARFYGERNGQAATMDDLLATLAEETGYDPKACAEAWLRSETVPDEGPCP